jgi:plasmid stabilization system protein ParE
MRRTTFRVTQNFERNLDDLRRFAADHLGSGVFNSLIDDLFERGIPNLERFPNMGVDFRSRTPQSIEGLRLRERLDSLVDDQTAVREYFAAPFVILYAHRGRSVHLLSVKHGRQLSFDLGGHLR